MRRRVLVATEYFPPADGGGATRALINLIQALSPSIDFHIVTRGYHPRNGHAYDVDTTSWARVGGARVRYLERVGGLTRLGRLIREVQPDVLFLNSVFSTLTLRTLLLRRFGMIPGVPVVLVPEGELDRGALQIKPAKKAVYLALISSLGLLRQVRWKAASALEEQNISRRLRIDNITIVPPPASPSAAAFRCPDRARPKQPGAARFIFVSRIVRKKNLTYALEALAGVRGEIHFDIVGDREDRAHWEECRALLERFPKHIRVTTHGHLPHEQTLQMLAGAHALILPTLAENFGYVIAEALSTGCPVLISDNTPWSDVPQRGAGWIVPLNSPDEWRSRLQEIVAMSEEELRACSARAHALAAERFGDSPAIERQYLALLAP